MSGLEIVGLAASVVQIADYGWKPSYKLYAFSKKVHGAGKTVELISQDISATGAVLKQLGDRVEKDVTAARDSRICSHGLITAASKLVEECKNLFTEIDISIGGKDGNKVILGFKQKLKWSYLEPRIELLRANLERLKSSLAIMLNVLIYAEQLRSREERTVLTEQQGLVASFASQKADAEKSIEQLSKSVETGLCLDDESRPMERKGTQGLAALPRSGDVTLGPWHTAMAEDTVLKTPMHLAIQFDGPEPVSSITGNTNSSTNAINMFSVPQSKSVAEMTASTNSESKSPPLSGLPHLEQHRSLIEKILEEVNSSRYAIDHGLRYRLHDGILDLHWTEWSPLRSQYGDNALRALLTDSPVLARHWHERLLKTAAPPARPSSPHLIVSDASAELEIDLGTPPPRYVQRKRPHVELDICRLDSFRPSSVNTQLMSRSQENSDVKIFETDVEELALGSPQPGGPTKGISVGTHARRIVEPDPTEVEGGKADLALELKAALEEEAKEGVGVGMKLDSPHVNPDAFHSSTHGRLQTQGTTASALEESFGNSLSPLASPPLSPKISHNHTTYEKRHDEPGVMWSGSKENASERETIVSSLIVKSEPEHEASEHKKREYNRNAQRVFRQRRKEHLSKLEQAQEEQSKIQSEEIKVLLYENQQCFQNESIRASDAGYTSTPTGISPSNISFSAYLPPGASIEMAACSSSSAALTPDVYFSYTGDLNEVSGGPSQEHEDIVGYETFCQEQDASAAAIANFFLGQWTNISAIVQ